MKKFLGRLMIVFCCIAMISSCGSEEDVDHTREAQIPSSSMEGSDYAEAVEEFEESVATGDDNNREALEDDVQNSENMEVIDEEAATVTETVETQEDELDTASIVEGVSTTEEVAETKKTTYTYKDLSQTMYASQSVNVRSLPSADGEKLGGLSYAEEVTVTGQCNETSWYRIEYRDAEGYVSNSYLVNDKPVQMQTPASTGNSNGSATTGNSVTVPTHEETTGNLVWVPVNGGKKYHSKASCSNMENPMQVSIDTAIANNYTACKKCY